ncbi:MAG: glycosyltransferase family 2 protein, partial [Candidatus Omnitrophica bacterium]|nr:glycosyltransferase family 2 protein [Candidatus Omnitrophota bacterium]
KQGSRLGSILGAHGALYAIRRALYPPLERNAINDDYLIPVRIRAQGFRSIYEPKAVCREESQTNVEGELRRRVRITAGNYQQIWHLRSLLWPPRGWLGFQFLSHKVLRTLLPLWLLGAFFASWGEPAVFYRTAALGQTAFYGLGLTAPAFQRLGLRSKLLTIPFYFLLVNVAGVLGVVELLRPRPSHLWKRPEEC